MLYLYVCILRSFLFDFREREKKNQQEENKSMRKKTWNVQTNLNLQECAYKNAYYTHAQSVLF